MWLAFLRKLEEPCFQVSCYVIKKISTTLQKLVNKGNKLCQVKFKYLTHQSTVGLGRDVQGSQLCVFFNSNNCELSHFKIKVSEKEGALQLASPHSTQVKYFDWFPHLKLLNGNLTKTNGFLTIKCYFKCTCSTGVKTPHTGNSFNTHKLWVVCGMLLLMQTLPHPSHSQFLSGPQKARFSKWLAVVGSFRSLLVKKVQASYFPFSLHHSSQNWGIQTS